MRMITIASTQMACTDNLQDCIAHGEKMVRQATAKGANIILLQELFEGSYFCQDEDPAAFQRAHAVKNHPTIEHFKELAKELGVVLPISFYEHTGQARFNSIAIIDADGTNLGVYRKSHIPHGFGYQEKFYFSPGDTGFKVWDTAFGRIGVGICWDQWFPECARSMALMGAEILFYPTAIGSELGDEDWNSSAHWQRVQQGHAGANLIPLVASNRIGTEAGLNGTEMTFYGSSFITDQFGEKVQEADRSSETVLVHSFDLDEVARTRDYWCMYRDRRPELYGAIATLDGTTGGETLR